MVTTSYHPVPFLTRLQRQEHPAQTLWYEPERIQAHHTHWHEGREQPAVALGLIERTSRGGTSTYHFKAFSPAPVALPQRPLPRTPITRARKPPRPLWYRLLDRSVDWLYHVLHPHASDVVIPVRSPARPKLTKGEWLL